jgi:hypothetical protein
MHGIVRIRKKEVQLNENALPRTYLQILGRHVRQMMAGFKRHVAFTPRFVLGVIR